MEGKDRSPKKDNKKSCGQVQSDDCTETLKGGYHMTTCFAKNEAIIEREVIGYRELRNNLSSVMSKVLDGKDIVSGNINKKENGDTATIIATTLLNDILNIYEFNPIITFDEGTGQYEAIIEEIGATGFGETLEELYEITLDNVIDLTEDFFRDIDKYIKFNKYRKQYPYYLRLKYCSTRGELLNILGLGKNSKQR